MIKAQRGAGTTTADAMRVLMMDSGRGEEASRSPWADADVCERMIDHAGALTDLTNVDKETKNDAVKDDKGSSVVDSTYDFACGILEVDEKEGRVMAVAPGVGLREFAFDAVFVIPGHLLNEAVYSNDPSVLASAWGLPLARRTRATGGRSRRAR